LKSKRTRGVCIGIIPCASASEPTRPKDGYPNEFVELPIFTHLPYSGERGQDALSRNHINVLSSDAVIALPGEDGTAAEVSLALTYGKPVVVYSPDPGLVSRFSTLVPRVSTLGEVEEYLDRWDITD